MDQKFPMVAKTFQGLEDVLRDELISLGAENVELGTRMVSFEGDLEVMYKANLCCRTALRILKPIEKFTAHDTDELYDIVREIDWEKYMTVDSTFSIDSTVNSAEFTHSKFVTYRVKDGIADHFTDKYGHRPSIRLAEADIQFNVHIFENRVTISLDSSGEPLCHRGYRVASTEAPINEVLAAGIIMKTGWRGDCDFADPMCGSGTFLIEAALIAANINPGIYRKSFAFEKWPDFNSELFEDLYNDDSAERDFNFKIFGGDIDPEAVAAARKNIRSAKVEDMISLTCKSMDEWIDNPEEGVLVMNPPYGERIRPESMSDLYHGIGSNLKRNFGGWNAWIIGYKDEHFADIGLKPSVKIPILNGSLECSLREYVLFDGKYADFRADGGNIGNEKNTEKHRPMKMKRISDDEWKAETKKFGSHKSKDFSKGKHFDKERKPFNQERKPFDKERKSFDQDRKPFDKERKSFDRDRKPYDKERKPFDRDRKPFDKERKSFDRDHKPYDRDNKPFDKERKFYKRDAVAISNRGPELPEDNAVSFHERNIVSRKKWKKNSPEQE